MFVPLLGLISRIQACLGAADILRVEIRRGAPCLAPIEAMIKTSECSPGHRPSWSHDFLLQPLAPHPDPAHSNPPLSCSLKRETVEHGPVVFAPHYLVHHVEERSQIQASHGIQGRPQEI